MLMVPSSYWNDLNNKPLEFTGLASRRSLLMQHVDSQADLCDSESME